MKRFLRMGVLVGAAIGISAPDTLASGRPEAEIFILQEGYDRYPYVGASITLIKSQDVNIIADPGMSPDINEVLVKLHTVGLDKNDIDYVFLTHHHPDHSLYMGLFPKAKIIDNTSTYNKDYWGEHAPDNHTIAPGVIMVATPGHAAEGASLLVDTNDGMVAITHLWWHSDMTPDEDPFAVNQAVLDKSRGTILKNADWIIPGHGAKFKNPFKK